MLPSKSESTPLPTLIDIVTLADHLAREPRFASFFAAYAESGTILNGSGAPFTVLRRRSGWRVESSVTETR